jgi:hypothetical protein
MTPGTFEQIAAMLGASGADWAIDRLNRYAPLVGYRTKGYDDSFDRTALEAAFDLETWLMIEARASEMIAEDYPDCVDQASNALFELLPLIARYIRQPGKRGGPTPDNRRWLCAHVCAGIWREFHDTAGSNSDTLLGACEAYWQACGQPPTTADLSGHLRNWKWFLASNSPEKSEVR